MKTWMVMALVLAMVPRVAAAEEDAKIDAKSGPEFGVGARIGGYGFREVQEEGPLSWEACRMDGFGLYGTVDIAKYLFGELSFDAYHSVGNDWDMDRISFFPAGAVGARLLPGKLISPYVQAGGGPEITRIELAGQKENMVLPAVFMGIGGELNIKSFHFGTVIKVFSMGLPEYEEPQAGPEKYYYPNNVQEPADGIAMRNEVAAQVQFSARYTF